jgi:acyl-CoA reductase-like NAD-dependent aldehyde dehydrogenase
MEMNWSRWFRCESSFGLLLVPAQPGIYALAEEIVQPAGPSSRRMLAVFEVDETEDLARALSRLFTAASPWRERLAEGRCYLRYAVADNAEERRGAASALKNWLNSQREMAGQIFELATMAGAQTEPATISERAVDRVSKTREYQKVFPQGF